MCAEGPARLGHRRLAIIDLPGRPSAHDRRHPARHRALVYSGEAYHFGELRGELTARGHRFTTDSDTEVVLRGYLEWGDAVAERLNGMYAFAVWDGRTDRLLLIRDRMGIKPLYYHPTPDGVLFGSDRTGVRHRVYWEPRTRLHTTTATPPSPPSARSSTTSCAASSSPTCPVAPCSPAVSTPPP
ncbi:hypothetical protein [Streptomyces sp. NPDC050416]|uniref:hypothetical protein n=1 Tax=Streptomyces sp. NPDC050416 TaxID=3365611 RepID=UPI0037B01F34